MQDISTYGDVLLVMLVIRYCLLVVSGLMTCLLCSALLHTEHVCMHGLYV